MNSCKSINYTTLVKWTTSYKKIKETRETQSRKKKKKHKCWELKDDKVNGNFKVKSL